jgi:peptide deformylase
MYDTMISKNGIGLAAIQIAQPLNVLLINLPDQNDEQKKEDLIEIINPIIKDSYGSTTYKEGCLSVPEFYEDVQRAEWIKLEYQDRDGKKCELECEDLLSIAIQHECDHLNGELFVEKLSYLKRKKFEKEWKKRLKEKK